jgi:hypothetical protein
MLALDGIINQSVVPLRVATYVGISISFFTLLAILGYLVAYFTVELRISCCSIATFCWCFAKSHENR